jgi:hypothetical protein
MPTPLRQLYRSIGKNLAQDKRTCNDLIAGLQRSSQSSLVSIFVDSLQMSAPFDGCKQPFLNEASLKKRKAVGPGSRGDNRIVYLLSAADSVHVEGGPKGYEFTYVGRQLPPFRQEGLGVPRSGAGGIDYTARTATRPVLGEIKRTGDKNAFYAFVQLLTYLSEMATDNQARRAAKFKEFGMKLAAPQPFDLHILLVDPTRRSATFDLFEKTKTLADLFRSKLPRDHRRLLGKILCLEMDSKAFAETDTPTLQCLWSA